jgi:hypothetical protein
MRGETLDLSFKRERARDVEMHELLPRALRFRNEGRLFCGGLLLVEEALGG